MRAHGALLVTLALALGGCGGEPETVAQPDDSASALSPPAGASPRPTGTPIPTPTPAPATGTVVGTADSEFGEILFDGTGQAIYLFDKEATAQPECYDDCAEAWPPVLTEGDPVAAGNVLQDQLGVTQRTDGTTQLSYAGHPLYYYANEGANQVLCHNVREFGGLWLVVTASGDPAP
jgi:predicted lipoprotein with Yx(FWY)xxD motif